ncbi:SET domain containing 8 [Megalopta genalis]|uniref:SET domain containing 8 n=1 Tax=Megalopta genalis TaxID=115081 RepID=UPI00144311D9|nr:N-lysine methyltransferase KMT5A-A [Megalopta genalis]
MRRFNSRFHLSTKILRNNMVKERRKRLQTKSMVCTRATVSSLQHKDIGVSIKKEQPMLDNNKNLKHDQSIGTHVAMDVHKSILPINSCFYRQITPISRPDLSETETSIVPIKKETFYIKEEANVVQNDIVSDVSHFTTDETPVAVPIHGPSTPHRINMPHSQIEDLDEGNRNTQDDKKPVISAITLTQQPLKKPNNRGRRKLNGNQVISHRSNESSDIKSTNHKLTDYFPVRRSIRKSKKVVLEEKQRDMENKVLCQVEEGLEVRYFAGKGRGVVTTREFTKGEFVVEYIGELISQVEAKKREKIYAQDQTTGCYMYYFQHRNHQHCVDATAETDKLGRLVNHSRNGNLVARVIEVGSTPHLVLTAKENIPSGIEVTYDYGDRSREAIRYHPWLAL